MRIGISITSAYRVGDVRYGAQQMIERARAANHAGLDSLFVGDQHVTAIPYYQNVAIIGRLLAEWDDRPAGILMLLPLWNPVLAAEQLATLASIARGPFILQCGLGHGERAFKAMGANLKHRPSAFEESLATIRQLFAGETVSLDSRWQFENASISPLPPTAVDVWVGASAVPAINRAARLGDAWLASPSLTLTEAGESLNIYRQGLAEHGKPEPATIAIRRDIYVAESAADAARVRDEIEQNGYRGFDPSALVIGEPGVVAEDFAALAELGYTDIIVRNLHPDQEKAVASTLHLASVRAELTI